MPDDSLRERGRALEEEYFRKRDSEFVEKMRRAAAADKTRQELSAASGLQDPELVKELEELGLPSMRSSAFARVIWLPSCLR